MKKNEGQKKSLEGLKYYKGEKRNPYEEVSQIEGQKHYNAIASMLWDFEYHWVNGWEKYNKLPESRTSDFYFRRHKNPQHDFKNILGALQAFTSENYSRVLPNGSVRWLKYVYDHAMLERFFKPVFNIVPPDEIPNYLRWYKGEAYNPYENEPKGSSKHLWWMIECGWYIRAEKLDKEKWEELLHDYIASQQRDDISWDRMTEQERKAQLKAYTLGVARWTL